MTDTFERHGLSLAETHGLDESGLLNTIHQRWLERTGNGDSRMIMSQFVDQGGVAGPDDTLVSLFDGYVARIGADRLDEDEGLDEYSIYLVGRRFVRAHIESTAPGELTINGMIAVIKAGYRSDNLADLAVQAQNGNLEKSSSGNLLQGRAYRPVNRPRIQRVRRIYGDNLIPDQPIEEQRDEALRAAFHKKAKLAEIRAGLRNGKISLEEALASPYVEFMSTEDILLRVPGVGEVTSGAALKAIGVAEETEIGTLTDDQKIRLAEMFPTEKYQPIGGEAHANRNQVIAALEKANHIRSYRAALKIKLAGGEITAEEVFEDPAAAGMKIRDVILKLPTRRGSKPASVKSVKLLDVVLAETDLSGSKHYDKLTSRQQQQLLDCLAARYNEEKGTYTYREPK